MTKMNNHNTQVIFEGDLLSVGCSFEALFNIKIKSSISLVLSGLACRRRGETIVLIICKMSFVECLSSIGWETHQ